MATTSKKSKVQTNKEIIEDALGRSFLRMTIMVSGTMTNLSALRAIYAFSKDVLRDCDGKTAICRVSRDYELDFFNRDGQLPVKKVAKKKKK